jgi:pimeloyl-ACP methyl ester carboxylesterase
MTGDRLHRLINSSFVSFLLLALLSASVWAAPARAQQEALPGSYAAAPCPFGEIAGLTVDCGYLTVAESRSVASGRTIQLAVAIVRSPNPAKATDPVLFLSGGPGEPALPYVPGVAAAYASTLAQRDIVFIDQRGTGYSQPALNCTVDATTVEGFTFGAQANDRPDVVQLLVDTYNACGQQYRAAGINLNAYTSVESAADLEDLRRALGYRQWNLLAVSYGTRLALTAMQYRPETIRSAVLDSVYLLEENFHTGIFASYNQSLSRLFANCAADAACNAAYPQLDHTFDEMILRLNAAPLQVPLRDLESGEITGYLPMAGVDVSFFVFQMLYIEPVIPFLPRLIADSARGDVGLLSSLFSSFLTERTEVSMPLVSQGLQIAMQCNEDATFAKAQDFVAARDQHRRASALAFNPLFNEAMLEVCAAWGLQATSPAENQPVRSDVPALLLAGEYDPVTPSQNAAHAHQSLGSSYLIAYPGGGHAPSSGSPCLANAIAAFFANALQQPDTSCLAAEPPQPFVVSQ